ncbi:TetR-like C-terminal domain-containing protein [Streptomyces sannanensis]|uniref:TetR-like C-terminal domain-containing protein n=1 Tax=Streptomyces sannanensis TaxID=285536 RepID=UPI003CD060D7
MPEPPAPDSRAGNARDCQHHSGHPPRLRHGGLSAADPTRPAACARAVHGFAVLEAEGAFGLPENSNESYDLLIHMMIA